MSLSRVNKGGSIDATFVFDAVVAIARSFAIALKEEVNAIVNGIFTVGGLLIGGVAGGSKGCVLGALAGSNLANALMRVKKIENLAKYLSNQLPETLRKVLANIFMTLMQPFVSVAEAVEVVEKSPELTSHFKNLMTMFFKQNRLAVELVN